MQSTFIVQELGILNLQCHVAGWLPSLTWGIEKNALPPQWNCIQKQLFKVCSPDEEKFVLEFILVNIFSRENEWSLYILSLAHLFQALLYMGTNQSFVQKKNRLGHQMILAGCHPNRDHQKDDESISFYTWHYTDVMSCSSDFCCKSWSRNGV